MTLGEKKKRKRGNNAPLPTITTYEEIMVRSSIILDGQEPSMVDVTIDFETYYSSQCSLRKLSTVEYITHPDFEVIGAGVKINDGKFHWVLGAESLHLIFASIPWDRVRLIAHNALFDAAVLKIIFGHVAREVYCTMMASRPHIVPFTMAMSLDAVSKYIGTTEAKGSFVTTSARGKRLVDFSRDELVEFGEYCRVDVENCRAIYKHTEQTLSDDELRMLHLTLAKGLCPQFGADIGLLKLALDAERERKRSLLARSGIAKDEVMSNVKFAAALKNAGVEPPMKVSPRTGKQTFAFAKTDLEFQELLSHGNPTVAGLVSTRLGAKSTIEETRLQRFINVATGVGGMMPLPLTYYAAHTGRHGGCDKLNAQNLTKGSALRRGIIAPRGKKVVVSDLSQIEARMVAWLAGQLDMLEDFRYYDKVARDLAAGIISNDHPDAGSDVYCKFGTKTFRRLVTKSDSKDRFVSKLGVLSLMYQSGAPKFEHTVNASKVTEIDSTTAEQVVDSYRSTYKNIKQLWYTLGKMLESMIRGKDQTYKCLKFTHVQGTPAVVLPNGRVMYYPKLYRDESGEFWYMGNKGFWKKIYGGAFLENISQALSQIIIMDAELAVAKAFKYQITAAGQVHDELLYCVNEDVAEKFARVLTKLMTVPPAWAPDIPLECETDIGDCYADAK